MKIPSKWMRRDHPTDPRIRLYLAKDLCIAISSGYENKADYHVSFSTRDGTAPPTEERIICALKELGVSIIEPIPTPSTTRHFIVRDSNVLS